jgi:hypothetical protein
MRSSLARLNRGRIVVVALLMATAAFGGMQLLFLGPPADVVGVQPVRGDFDLDGEANARDLAALVMALRDPAWWMAETGGTYADLLAVGDFDGDGAITRVDREAFVSEVVAPPDVRAARAELGFGAAPRQVATFSAYRADLDMDTDHTNSGLKGPGPEVLVDRDDNEDDLEELGAARCVCQNGDDDDGDGLVDYDDPTPGSNDPNMLFDLDMVPLALEIRPLTGPAAAYTVRKYRIDYEPPVGYAGQVRLWRDTEHIEAASFSVPGSVVEYEHMIGIHGDINLDGAVDFADVNPYVNYLDKPQDWIDAVMVDTNHPAFSDPNVWAVPYEAKERFLMDLLDMNNDRQVDFDDINPFVDAIQDDPNKYVFVPVWLYVEAEPLAGWLEDARPVMLRGVADVDGDGVLDDTASYETDTVAIAVRRCHDVGMNCDNDSIPGTCEPVDCNCNGVPDVDDIAGGTSADCNTNGTPDECERDCNGNGVADECELVGGTAFDCDGNGVLDECDISAGTSADCNANGVPDECDVASLDCNANGVPDDCDIDPNDPDMNGLISQDCEGNGVPDECYDPNFAAFVENHAVRRWTEQGVEHVHTYYLVLENPLADPNSNGWENFRAHAVSSHMSLAVVNDQVEDSWIMDHFTDPNYFTNPNAYVPEWMYLGLYQEPNSSEPDLEWMWVEEGVLSGESEYWGGWCTGQPDNGIGYSEEQDWAAISTEQECWHDHNDWYPYYALYESRFEDCDGNGRADCVDINEDPNRDCNQNTVVDRCEWQDCNGNAILDACDIDPNDPDGNGLTSNDCDGNGEPDECQLDCNGNGIFDYCEDPNMLGFCDPGDRSLCDVELLFLVDTSGSMLVYYDDICEIAESVAEDMAYFGASLTYDFRGVATFNAGGSLCFPLGDTNTVEGMYCAECDVDRFLVDCGDPNDPSYVWLESCDPVQRCENEDENSAESWGAGVAVLSSQHPWLSDHARLIVVMSDEAPYLGDPSDSTDDLWTDAAACSANSNQVVVSAFVEPGSEAEGFANLLANSTGGAVGHISTDPNEVVVDPVCALRDFVAHACLEWNDCNGNGILDACEIANGTKPDVNGNGVPDDCETLWAFDVVARAYGVVLDPNYTVPECAEITFEVVPTSSDVTVESIAWDWGDDPNAAFAGRVVAPMLVRSWECDGSAGDANDVVVFAQVTTADGPTVKSFAFQVADSAPTVALAGPDELMSGQAGCFQALISAGCDAIELVEWDWDGDGVPDVSFEDVALGVQQWHAWPAVDPGLTVMVWVEDADGSRASATFDANIVDAAAVYTAGARDISVLTGAHVYDPQFTDGDGFVLHAIEMQIRNDGPDPLTGPAYVLFSNVQPAGGQLVNPASDPALPPGALAVEILAAGQTLDPNEASAIVPVQWQVPSQDATPFAYDVAPYVRDRLPYFVDVPVTATVDEKELLDMTFTAVDPEGTPVFYELASTQSDPATADDPPAGMYLNSATGRLRWRPGSQAGAPAYNPYDVMVIARDGFGYVTHTLSITVNPVNEAPVIESAPQTVTTVEDSASYSYLLTFSDPDGDALDCGNVTLEAPPNFVAGLSGGPDGECLLSSTGGWSEGVHALRITVSDGEKSDVQEYDLAVLPCDPNDRPEIDCDPNDQAAVEGQPFTYQVWLTDPNDLPPVYYSVDLGPANLQIDQTTGAVYWEPGYNDHGKRLVRVRATTVDEACADTCSFLIDVEDRNGPPVFTSALPLHAREGETLSFTLQADDPDDDRIRFVLVQGPDGMVLDPDTGVVRWPVPHRFCEPPVNCPATVEVAVVDAVGVSATMAADITVEAWDAPPVITSYPPLTAFEQEGYTYPVVYHDPDATGRDAPAVAVLSGPVGMTAQGNAISWLPPAGAADESPYFVEYGVVDADGTVLVSDTYWLEVYRRYVPNEPPAFVAPAPQYVMNLGDTGSFDLRAVDPDIDDELELTVTTEPARDVFSIGPPSIVGTEWTWNVAWAAPTDPNHAGVYDVRFALRDAQQAGQDLYYDLYVLDPTATEPPEIVVEPNAVAFVGEAYAGRMEVVWSGSGGLELTPVAAHVGGDPSGALVQPPVGFHSVNLTAVQGTHAWGLTWTPTADDVGVHWIACEIGTPGGAYVRYTYALQVVSGVSNTPPAVVGEPPARHCWSVGEAPPTYVHDVDVEDADPGDTHTFRFEEAPARAHINSQTGLVTWDPPNAPGTVHWFKVVVEDAAGAGAWIRWPVQLAQVMDPNDCTACADNALPEITNAPPTRLAQGVVLDWTPTIVDDGGTAVVRLLAGPETLDWNEPAGAVQWDTAGVAVGTYTFQLEVRDGCDAWSRYTYGLTVSLDGMNLPPQVSAPEQVLLAVGSPLALAVQVQDDRTACGALAVDVLELPTGASCSAACVSAVIDVDWTPMSGDVGVHWVGLRITDGDGAWVQVRIPVIVSASGANRPPVITSTPPETVDPNDVYSYDVEVFDPDVGDVHAFEVVRKPTGLTATFAGVEGRQLRVSGFAPAGDTYTVDIRVRDAEGAADEQRGCRL